MNDNASTTPDATPTQPAIPSSTATDVPSWQGPVNALESRVGKLETQQATIVQQLDRVEKKTDAQSLMLAEIKGAVVKAAANPYVRALGIAIAFAIAGWLTRHGIKVEIPQ